MRKFIAISFLCAAFSLGATAARYDVTSPDGSLRLSVNVGQELSYTLVRGASDALVYPSVINMDTDKGVFGKAMKVGKVRRKSVDVTIDAPLYKRAKVAERYNELCLCSKPYNVVFRVYDDGAAYRFEYLGKDGVIVNSELAQFNFGKDRMAYVPYVRKIGDFNTQFFNTFENTYVHDRLCGWEEGRLAFLPLMVEMENGVKVCVTEADLHHYPGMYLFKEGADCTLSGVFAPYPKKERQGSHDPSVTVGGHNKVVVERESYIARCNAGDAFPWRVLAVAADEAQLLDSDLVYKLSEPSRIEDVSWIKPGMVAWEWWNDRNIIGVDFEAGVNNDTYKYYIDFASRNNIPYVVLDDGWYDAMAGDAFAVVPTINLPELIEYAKQRNVGLMLWVGYYVFQKDMEKVIGDYAAMGIKGFKLDAIGRDDQKLNEFYYTAAEIALRNKVVLDFHGGAKPAGLNRTYPNVLNFEGVHGLEQLKNKSYDCDLVTYDVIFPFIRGVAGPYDYTQGAMINAARSSYRSIWSTPMSQGTRCRQLAEYVIFESPLNMLCDSPSNYYREQECTDFITAVPTVWADSKVLEGKMGSHITMARQAADGSWYVGGLTGWQPRDCELDLSFLPEGEYAVEIFRDGTNAHRNGNDYKRETASLRSNDNIKLHLAPGGGFALKITKK